MGTAIICLGAVVYIAILSVPRTPRYVWRRLRKGNSRLISMRKRRRFSVRKEIDMGIILTEVATRLRSGATIDAAWSETLRHCAIVGEGDGVALMIDDDGVPQPLRQLWALNPIARMRRGVSPIVLDSIPATIAVCRMGHSTGAPMADILDACALGVTEAMEARAAREVALAGPESSAYMLALLPIIGVALGYAMGADPLGFLLGSMLGNVVLAAGCVCEISGIILVRKLVQRAVREDAEL